MDGQRRRFQWKWSSHMIAVKKSSDESTSIRPRLHIRNSSYIKNKIFCQTMQIYVLMKWKTVHLSYKDEIAYNYSVPAPHRIATISQRYDRASLIYYTNALQKKCSPTILLTPMTYWWAESGMKVRSKRLFSSGDLRGWDES